MTYTPHRVAAMFALAIALSPGLAFADVDASDPDPCSIASLGLKEGDRCSWSFTGVEDGSCRPQETCYFDAATNGDVCDTALACQQVPPGLDASPAASAMPDAAGGDAGLDPAGDSGCGCALRGLRGPGVWVSLMSLLGGLLSILALRRRE